MILPCRAIMLINQYSKPITRSDWRTFKRIIPIDKYIEEINKLNTNKTYSLFKLVDSHMYKTNFFKMYHHIYCFGIDDYIKTYGGNKQHILSDRILNARNESYIEYSKNIYCNKIWMI